MADVESWLGMEECNVVAFDAAAHAPVSRASLDEHLLDVVTCEECKVVRAYLRGNST